MASYTRNNAPDYSAENDFNYSRWQPERNNQQDNRRQSTSRSRGSSAKSNSSSFNGMHRRRNKHWSW